jgi:predicted  nucleic acid-binding Zn-ribbon protein
MIDRKDGVEAREDTKNEKTCGTCKKAMEDCQYLRNPCWLSSGHPEWTPRDEAPSTPEADEARAVEVEVEVMRRRIEDLEEEVALMDARENDLIADLKALSVRYDALQDERDAIREDGEKLRKMLDVAHTTTEAANEEIRRLQEGCTQDRHTTECLKARLEDTVHLLHTAREAKYEAREETDRVRDELTDALRLKHRHEIMISSLLDTLERAQVKP